MTYRRVLLKLSGEMLGKNGILFDQEKIDRTAAALVEASRLTAIAVVIGAGNIWRGRQAEEMDAVTADQMGMLGTVLNCLSMRDAVERAGGNAILYSALGIDRVAAAYDPHRAMADMRIGNVLLMAGGTGNPFFSTDTGVALRAVELKAEAILMAKNIDGVYDADPKQNPDARLIRDITYQEAMIRQLKVMDQAAFCICQERSIPVVRVFKLDDPGSIIQVLQGDDRGTVIHP